ncbi:MAG: NifU family protein [Pseudomonadota bacterium]|nr:NifU family protein [Pseudomonadota bacterium]
MFIQTEETPNPSTLKFLPGRDVMGAAPPADFPNAESAKASPLAESLFKIPQVSSVFLGSNFITITKSEDDWLQLKPILLTALMDFFLTGLPVINQTPALQDVSEGADGEEGDSEIVSTIKQLLDTRVRPAVAQDGGDIVFHGYEDGVVSLTMRGACAGCPSSTATLKHGIENLLKHFIPEINEVRAVEGGAEGDSHV